MTRALVLFAVVIAGALGAAAVALGLVTSERHTGYIAPVWSADGSAVLAIRRDTEGIVLGPGWEFFTPPAHALVWSDRYMLVAISPDGDGERRLGEIAESPLTDRRLRTYRGRAFTLVSGRLLPEDDALRLQLRISIPVVPRSEIWGIDTTWTGGALDTEWTRDLPGQFARPDEVLRNGREVMTVPGPEGFDAGVIVVEADGRFRTIARSPGFDAHYPDGIPPGLIAERSSRERIERGRLFRDRRAELIAEIMETEGLTEAAATLRAFDVMEREGLLPPRARIVAEEVAEAPPGLQVFDIPEVYLEVGLFQDIAAAIARPGEAVLSSTGSYLVYAGDDLGPRVKAALEDGGEILVRVAGTLWRIAPTRRP